MHITYKSILLTKNYKKLNVRDQEFTKYLLDLTKSLFKKSLKQHFKGIKNFPIMNIKGKLFHSFGPAAKKVQSPTFVQAITLGAGRRSPTRICSFSILILWWAPCSM